MDPVSPNNNANARRILEALEATLEAARREARLTIASRYNNAYHADFKEADEWTGAITDLITPILPRRVPRLCIVYGLMTLMYDFLLNSKRVQKYDTSEKGPSFWHSD